MIHHYSRASTPRELPDDLTERLRWLEDEIALLDRRLNRLESSYLFRILRRAGGIIATQQRKIGQILLKSPFHSIYLRLLKPTNAPLSAYAEWIAAKDSILPSRSSHQREASTWRFRPTISVLISTYRPRREWLARAIASVKAQSYERWQLCLCDDGSEEGWVREYLSTEAGGDPRIHVCFRETNGGISAGLNSAGELATGEYVTFLDHDDELDPYALHYVVEACQSKAVGLLYSDEDYLDSTGARCGPAFKPDWSPELLNCCMYFGHLLVARRSLLDEVGWFRSSYDGAQDYDLALRLVERAQESEPRQEIRHIRRVLYHWRQHPQSTALNPQAKPYAHDAGRRALADAALRCQEQVTIEDGPLPFTYYIRRSSTQPGASLVVCSRDPRRLSAFLAAQKRTRYSNIEVVVVEHLTDGGAGFDDLFDKSDLVRVRYEGPFNYSKMNNNGAEAARSGLLVFLNDDVAPLRAEWLEVMVAHLERPEIGVVGGRLLYPSGALQHAGVVAGMQDGVGHPGRGTFDSELMYYLQLPRDVSAVTGACSGVRRRVFDELGGFDPSFPVNYSDVDLCFRATRHGYRVIVDPRVEMTHLECGTRIGGTTLAERQRLRERWGGLIREGDPYYPEAFDRTTEHVRLAVQ